MSPILPFPRIPGEPPESSPAADPPGLHAEDPSAGIDLASGSMLLALLLLLQGIASAAAGHIDLPVVALLTAGAGLVAVAGLLHLSPPDRRWIQPLALTLSTVALIVVLGRVALHPTAPAALHLPLMLVATSLLFRSARWYAGFLAGSLVAWMVVGVAVFGPAEWEAGIPTVVVAALIGLTLQVRRSRHLNRIAAINADLRERADALEDAYDEASRSSERLAELSVRDPLTGAYNRRYLDQVQLELERPTAHWGCLMVDLNDFKSVNDRFGHDEGDRVLQGVAHFLRRQGRAEDRLVRVGGDEFVFIMEANSEEELHIIADRVERVGQRESPCPFTVGRAFRHPTEPMRDTLQRADSDMYRRKEGGASGGKTLRMRPRGPST